LLDFLDTQKFVEAEGCTRRAEGVCDVLIHQIKIGAEMKFWSNSEIPGAGQFVPEKRLLAAVLQRAITDFVTGDGELREGARAWLIEEEVTDAPLTFSFICEALDLDADNLRRAIVHQAEAAMKMAANHAAM
jgi:hypothetical protein